MKQQMQSPIHMISQSIKKLIKGPQQKAKQQLLSQLNSFRRDPTCIIPHLQKRKQNYSLQPPKNILFSPLHIGKGLTTVQGPSPINQLIGTLLSRDKMSIVIQNQFLTLIAQYIVQSLNQSANKLQEIKLTQSMAKHLRNQLNNCQQYNFVDKITCLIGVGFDGEVFEPLMSLLVDDGSELRKNRELMFCRNFRFVGIGTGLLKFSQQLRVCVYLFTGNIVKR